MLSLLALLAVTCVASAQAQPPACSTDDHCTSGRFCQNDFCHACLSCETLKRNSPPVPTKCIRSYIECGSCLEGLVVDRSETGNSGCVTPVEPNIPVYVWFIIAGAVIALLMLVGLYLFRTPMFKLISSIRTSVSLPDAAPAPSPRVNGFAPTAPQSQAPPPYQPYSGDYCDEDLPLVKPVLPLRTYADREAEAAQAARPFSNPNYVRNAPAPVSPEVMFEDEINREPPIEVHDEETRESFWMPGDSAGNGIPTVNGDSDIGGGGSGGAGDEGASNLLALVPHPPVRRASDSEYAPPAKIQCLAREDSNNNRDNDAGGSGEGRSAAGGPTTVTINFNIEANPKTVQQFNYVTVAKNTANTIEKNN